MLLKTVQKIDHSYTLKMNGWYVPWESSCKYLDDTLKSGQVFNCCLKKLLPNSIVLSTQLLELKVAQMTWSCWGRPRLTVCRFWPEPTFALFLTGTKKTDARSLRRNTSQNVGVPRKCDPPPSLYRSFDITRAGIHEKRNGAISWSP